MQIRQCALFPVVDAFSNNELISQTDLRGNAEAGVGVAGA